MGKFEKHITRELAREGHSSKVFSDRLNLIARGTDAGIYRLIPRLVVQINNEQDVIAALNVCRKAGLPVTFKAGGTSLSGQTVTDSVLLETGPGFNHHSVSGKGDIIKLQPGITGGYANSLLAGYFKKIGPSPASIASAKIGGIIGNNASGASYGIATNSYNTLRGLRLVFADGSVLDTLSENSRRDFSATHPKLIAEINHLSLKVRSDQELGNRIRHKYELKNTTGYGLNSLLDFENPIDVLWHLIVGSEGTLAFISEATFSTVDSYKLNAAALIILPDIREACRAIKPLLNCEVSAAELMDRNALLSVQNISGIPDIIRNPAEDTVALLIDTSAPNVEMLNRNISDIKHALSGIATLFPVEFIKDSKEYNRIWRVRKGLFTSAAGTRPKGTSCLIEDVAFRPEVLADALVAIRNLVSDYNYSGSVMWGHLLDGNVHFVIMPDFRSQTEVDKYRKFMDDFVRLTVHEFDGSLKAEHGTGRNMAPFVKEEWGNSLYSVMKNIKMLFDPDNLLNPGVLINEDPDAHIKNLKPIPVVNETIDKCIECGFCENDCPSKNLTFTPRQRIVAYRELFRENNIKAPSGYLKDFRIIFDYNVDETCATDGLCGLACPVNINTGELVKKLRASRHGWFSDTIAAFVGNNMKQATSVLRSVLNVTSAMNKLAGDRIMYLTSNLIHKISRGFVPLWNSYVPKGSRRIKINSQPNEGNMKVVYLPACINRTFGKSADYPDNVPELVEKTIGLLHKAGIQIIFPANLDSLCCGMAFDSKGYVETGLKKASELESALLNASDGGKIPVLCDMSPCLLRMRDTLTPKLDLYEPVGFTLKFLTSRLNIVKLNKSVTVHSTCSSVKMGLTDDLIRLAQLCCSEVIVPLEVGCCGWAGDRGFTVPELNASALKHLKVQMPRNVSEGYSTSRTCEIGLSRHSGVSYKSILYLVDEATSDDRTTSASV